MAKTLFLSVIGMSITACFVILVVIAVRLLLKKAPKIFSYALWAVVLFRLLCPFALETELSIIPSMPEVASINLDSMLEDNFQAPINITHGLEAEKAKPEQSVYISPFAAPTLWISRIWMLGCLAMLIYSIIQLARLKQKLIGATPLRENIYIADHINSPFVMGFIKPKIYLPSFMAKAEQEYIIAHEKHHIKRFDHIVRILGFVALTLHWFNPLVWLAFILSGKDMEMSCDEAVMKEMDTDIRAEYSKSLLRFATGRKLIAATPLAFGEGNTMERVKNVMRYKKPILWVSIIAVIAVACVIIGLMSNSKLKPPAQADNLSAVQGDSFIAETLPPAASNSASQNEADMIEIDFFGIGRAAITANSFILDESWEAAGIAETELSSTNEYYSDSKILFVSLSFENLSINTQASGANEHLINSFYLATKQQLDNPYPPMPMPEPVYYEQSLSEKNYYQFAVPEIGKAAEITFGFQLSEENLEALQNRELFLIYTTMGLEDAEIIPIN